MTPSQLRKIPGIGEVWQRLQAIPKPKPEESIGLRVGVQALVAVGIVATDIAAETSMSVWAIPLSFVGAAWSWQRREKRNIATKFLIAMGMLVALMYFFDNLLANLNDTRLVLAQLLIHLQVLHSFDLPRRRDLGYSMVIGLILLGVAGTISETLTFAPLLVVFLAIAIPVLILDYRSRLGFDQTQSPATTPSPRQKRRPYSPLSLPRLLLLFGVTVGAGLIIFALFPRFPGYQLQTMPVSSSSFMENQRFNEFNRGILRPGSGEEEGDGTTEEESITGEGGTAEEENALYYGFQEEFDLTQPRSQPPTPKVVMRVRSQAPGFWRVLAFDRYTGTGWDISREDRFVTIDRPSWTYRFYLAAPYSEKYTRTVIQTYTILEELPNLVPALYQSRALYFPTPEVAIDPEGSIRAPVALTEDLTYTVVSDVLLRDRTLLRQAPTNYNSTTEKYYLQLPPGVKARVKEKAEALLATASQPITSPYEKALFLAQALKQNYSEVPIFALEEDEDLVEAFLFKFEGGYIDHFPTVLAVMLRSLGIPSRVSVGYATGQFNPFTGFYLVRNVDAYPLTEVFFPEYGWFSFDPRPGYPLYPPSVEDTEAFGVVKQFWQWVAGWLPSPVTGFLGYLWTTIMGGLLTMAGRLWQFLSSSAIGLLSGIVVIIAMIFASWLSWQQLRDWLAFRRLRKLPPVEQIYRKMLHRLAKAGYPKHPAQTPLEYAATLSQGTPQRLHSLVTVIINAYLQWKYGEKAPNLPELQQTLRRLTRLTRQPQRLQKKDSANR
ncbi:DUF3488 and DUF4129 domain-containing transglutaminase family protein [Spirulina sp. CS-785/01]|uniref:transglutaminase TgpA family protein n=1 Tax=Spirulina sp. CS-785/01 TaxID=3021716 RepID=UPI00232F8908|nr:DUF3488 and DUF4129 domain-containing transglutaminase family protein [Spirulina sp. CS-785/01]MDB9313704.1 DUF3488 and DUF4129 domain-containing transglutaminase family protein [Spirulina sp. CS-785/01]